MVLSREVSAARYSGEGLLGYNGGLSVEVNALLEKISKDFPFLLQLGVSYTTFDPGKSDAARRIFINNATNGDPEEKGWRWDYRFDFLYKVSWFKLKRFYIHFGPRYTKFTGNFKYIGGNEDFEIVSNHWGLGTGMKAYFKINKKVDFVMTAGVDYFFESEMNGHDTTYDPDGEDINAREDYTYSDADEAISQPKIEVRALIGFNYNF